MELFRKHWPSGIIIAFLIGITTFLAQDRYENFSDADAKCQEEINKANQCIAGIGERVTRLETVGPYVTKAIDNNTQVIRQMASDISDIKSAVESWRQAEQYGRTDRDGGH